MTSLLSGFRNRFILYPFFSKAPISMVLFSHVLWKIQFFFFSSPCATQSIVGVYFTALYRALAFTRKSLLDHTQRRATVGRSPLNKRSVRRRDLFLTTRNTHNRQASMPQVGKHIIYETIFPTHISFLFSILYLSLQLNFFFGAQHFPFNL